MEGALDLALDRGLQTCGICECQTDQVRSSSSSSHRLQAEPPSPQPYGANFPVTRDETKRKLGYCLLFPPLREPFKSSG